MGKGAGAILFADAAGVWYPGTQIVDNSKLLSVILHAQLESNAQRIIFFVGDGMQMAHEVAASRYLYRVDEGLAWHSWPALSNGWGGTMTAWDVTTYDRYANAAGEAVYSSDDFDPYLGYDPLVGGAAPYPREADPACWFMPFLIAPSASAALCVLNGRRLMGCGVDF